MVAHGLRTVDGEPRRRFRCERCGKGFVPGAEDRRPDDAVRAAVRRVRGETDASYRLLADALTNHLGIDVSHTTVGTWCRAEADDDAVEGVPCEYLSLLWALRQEIETDLPGDGS